MTRAGVGALAGVGEAYDASASAWTNGPAAAYAVMARVLVSASPVPVAGARVLDLGTGTGVAARAARDRGAAKVTGIDVAPAMIAAGSGWDAVVIADAAALPFADGSFDLVVSAFCLGHLPDPVVALAGSRRVAPALVASAFRAGWTHPAKAIVDAVAGRYGFVVPGWYARLKSDVEPRVDDPVQLEGLARAAGYATVDVGVHEVDVGVRTPSQLTEWRLGMAHLAPFLADLDAARRGRLVVECREALAQVPALIVPVVVLAATSA